MLITFTSKAAAEVMMYKEHAKPILDMLNKETDRGVITAEETAHAVELLEREIADSRAHVASGDVTRDVNAHHNEAGDDTEHESAQTVSFSSRAYPLLEMLRAARDEKVDVLWGV